MKKEPLGAMQERCLCWPLISRNGRMDLWEALADGEFGATPAERRRARRKLREMEEQEQ